MKFYSKYISRSRKCIWKWLQTAAISFILNDVLICPCGWPQKTNTLRTNSQLARSVDVSVFTSEFLVGYCLYWIKVSMLSQSVALIAFSLTTAGERPGMRSQGNLSAILQTAVSNLPIAAHNWKPNGDKLRCVGSERDTGCYVLPCTG